ncbi:MAG: bifunctional oligoribonuclease/PAP phosphatase NrnA [Bacillota bacterium]
MRKIEINFNIFKGYKNIAILLHTRPDGDTIGSGLALYHALKNNFGVEADVLCDMPMPEKYFCLSGVEKVTDKPKNNYDLIVFCDCGDIKRVGTLPIILKGAHTITIDHHGTSENYSDENYIYAEAAANCVVMYEMFVQNNIEITKEMAELLYAGTMTDTGGFGHSNTTASVLKMAGHLAELGANPHLITKAIFKQQSHEKLLFLGEAFSKIKLHNDGQIATLVIKAEMLEKYGLDSNSNEGLIDHSMSISGVKIAINFLQVAKNRYKISIRSILGISAAEIASFYGGGGHTQAAGLSMQGSIEDIMDKVLYRASLYI